MILARNPVLARRNDGPRFAHERIPSRSNSSPTEPKYPKHGASSICTAPFPMRPPFGSFDKCLAVPEPGGEAEERTALDRSGAWGKFALLEATASSRVMPPPYAMSTWLTDCGLGRQHAPGRLQVRRARMHGFGIVGIRRVLQPQCTRQRMSFRASWTLMG